MDWFQPAPPAPGPRQPTRANSTASAFGNPPIRQAPPGNAASGPHIHRVFKYDESGNHTISYISQPGNLEVAHAPGLQSSSPGPRQVDPPELAPAQSSATGESLQHVSDRQEAERLEDHAPLIQIEEHHHPIELVNLPMGTSNHSVRNMLRLKWGIPECWLRGIRLIAEDKAIVHLSSWTLAAATVDTINKQILG